MKNKGNLKKRLINEISALDPDIIVITGDIVDSKHTIANDKNFWRLLFADPHGANFSLRMCEAL